MPDNDTIAAISTAYGTGGIGIVRISGPASFDIADAVFRGRKPFNKIKSHTINYGKIVDPTTIEVIDEVLVTKMAKPNTYTREDVVEINCHGGINVLKRILELVLKQGARLADPGEFTKRAFLNGRLDLSQAEAVIDLICSKTDAGSRAALSQLEGKLSEKVKDARKRLIGLIAHIDATIDFPEHDVEEITGKMVYEELTDIARQLERILDSFERGRILKEGINAVIVGKPNVGKSSLLNELTGKNRAIVTDIPGTTRDIIEDYVNISGIPLKVIDTAGIRETDDVIEKIGVEKTRKAIDAADLVIFMYDAGEGISDEDLKMLQSIKGKKTVVVANKIDLIRNGAVETPQFQDTPVVKTSLKYDIGIDELKKKIEEIFIKGEIDLNNEVLLTNIRHKNLLDSAVNSIREAMTAYENVLPLDFITIDIRNAAEFLGQITGESVTEDVINEIFSRFCIGK